MKAEELTILHEDDNILAVNKPAGLIVHGDGRTKEATVAEWLLSKYPEIGEVGEPIYTPQGKIIEKGGIVHRLDRDTSGVLLVAKNQEAFFKLKSQFKNRDIRKIYHAVLYGEIKEGEGTIDRSIGKSRSDFRKWSATRGSRGEQREAITDYKVLARKEGFSYVEAMPKTGRTHQIRVHFLAINHPVVADHLYASSREVALGFNRLALHARAIAFKNEDGKEMLIEAPFPEDFKEARRFFGLGK